MTVRLHVDQPLAEGVEIELSSPQAHYLRNVLRLSVGDTLSLFNGRDGEWASKLLAFSRKTARAECLERTRQPSLPPDLDYLFAPLKAARLDYLAQKATEMGVRRLLPVITERTVPQRVNLDRLRANAIEAAEQCNLVFVPEIQAPRRIEAVLADWPSARRLIHCDEVMSRSEPLRILGQVPQGPLAVLIGPEGGFSERERAVLASLPFVVSVPLGPRIMRADTAAVAALALVQATLGDWRLDQPR